MPRLFRFRWLLYELVLRDLRVRYRGTVLGLAWTILNPLLFMLIYTLVFSVYLRLSIPHYSLFLLSGLIPWMWLVNALQQGATSIVDGRLFVGKTTFPTEVLIAVPVCAGAVNFVFSLPVLLAFSMIEGVHPLFALLALPVLMAVQLLITYAIVQLAATLNVFYRDIAQLTTYATTALFYLTPIFYMESQVPSRFHFILAANPLSGLIAGYQAIFYYGQLPSMHRLLFPTAAAAVLLLLAQGSFLRMRESFTEYL